MKNKKTENGNLIYLLINCTSDFKVEPVETEEYNPSLENSCRSERVEKRMGYCWFNGSDQS